MQLFLDAVVEDDTTVFVVLICILGLVKLYFLIEVLF